MFDPFTVEAVFAEFQPTHVVSDLVMPGRDGLAVLRLARQHLPAAVRVLLSGSLDSVTEAQLHEVMPCRLVSKPWRDETLAVDLGLEHAP